MSSQSLTQNKAPSALSDKKSIANINSTDALAMIEHGSDIILSVTTPVGTTFRCKTQFVGVNSDNLILVDMPNIDDNDLEFFFKEGFWATLRAISTRGEGANLTFKSQLQHILHSPISCFTFSVPQSMKISTLRKEPRFETNLSAFETSQNKKINGQIRDISKQGCCFCIEPLNRSFLVGDRVTIMVQLPGGKPNKLPPLTGTVRNLKKNLHHYKYGIMFDNDGLTSAKEILSELKFNGTTLIVKELNS